jgi:hypothetical protein
MTDKSKFPRQTQERFGEFVIEFQYTRDAKIPLVADDWDFEWGWRCVRRAA